MAENDGECPRDLKKIITEISLPVLTHGLHRYVFRSFRRFRTGSMAGYRFRKSFPGQTIILRVPTDMLRNPKVQLPRCVLGLLSAQSFSRCYSAKYLIKFLGIIWYADLDSRLNSLQCRVFFPAGATLS